MKHYWIYVAVLLLGCGACTTRGAYEGIRQGQRNHCNEVPDTEREKCLAKTQDDFDAYHRKRDEVSQHE